MLEYHHAGIPPYFSSWQEFRHYFETMRQCGVYRGAKDLYWDLRPRPDFGTLEFRICDAPASLEVLLGLTALIHCLVLDGLRRLEKYPSLGRQGPERTWLAVENKFLASRYGLRAECILEPTGPRQTLEEQTEQLLLSMMSVAADAGEERFLLPFLDLKNYESGSDHLRRLYRQTGTWQPVLEEMKLRLFRVTEQAGAGGDDVVAVPGVDR